MEELGVEDKAKRYDEAIDVINKCETDKYGCLLGVKPTDIFPELKEGEDELTWLKRFIKEEIDCLRYDIRDYKDSAKLDNLERALAWLERQGEYINFRNTAKVGDRITKGESGVLVNLSQFERMAKPKKEPKKIEQEPANAPKFKVGDWIVKNDGKDSFSDGSYALQITGIDNMEYKLSNGHSLREPFINTYRLWTIQDAKDGDVLFTDNKPDCDWIFIFESFCRYTKNVRYHAMLSGSDRLIIGGGTCYNRDGTYHPATKEQRDILVAEMEKAGYMWDAEKKELKMIEQEKDVELTDFESALFTAFSDAWQEYLSGKEVNVEQWAKEHSTELLEVAREQKAAWSEEDEMFVNGLVRGLTAKRDIHGHITFSSDCIDITKTIKWLKSLKDRVQPQPKQEWSGEDEAMLQTVINRLELSKNRNASEIPYVKRCVEWLKNLRHRSHWKPSDEQMKALGIAIRCGIQLGTWEEKALKELREQLKKLREE